jgi:hypothetical protein
MASGIRWRRDVWQRVYFTPYANPSALSRNVGLGSPEASTVDASGLFHQLCVPMKASGTLLKPAAAATLAAVLLCFFLVPRDASRPDHRWLPESLKSSWATTQQPFARFDCLDPPHVSFGTGPYRAGFRFHVYQDLPEALVSQVVELASAGGFWEPGNAESHHITEALLTRSLPSHPCHTTRPEAADVFFVPAQTASAILLLGAGRNDEAETRRWTPYQSDGECEGFCLYLCSFWCPGVQ